LALGEVAWTKVVLPDWIQFVLAAEEDEHAGFSSIEDVRKKYRRMKDGK